MCIGPFMMETVYTAGLIVIGDEILRGQVIDTNTSYLAKKLRASGIKLRKITVIPDIVDEIAKIVLEASREYSVVFTSGGVGPTHDDVTYEAVAKGLELKLEQHEELIEIYANLFPNNEEAKRLTIVPKPCELIYVYSPRKYAVVKVKNVYILPGSPKYFEFSVDAIIPQLKGTTPLHFEQIDINLNELSIVKILDEHAERWKDKVNIGSYPQITPECFTRITLEGKKEDVLEAKGEFLYTLPIQNIRNIENAFSYYHAKAVFKDAENEVHVKSALDILQQCYKTYMPEEVFVSFNGGKDCTVVLHLAACVAKLQNISSLLCLYVTAEPFPEVDSFVEKAAQYYGLELIRKKSPMQSALHSLLSEKANLKASLMGMRKGDPGTENLETFTPTDPSWPSLIRVNPILNWSYEQVWKFLLKHNVPYCPLYDKGYTSLGTKSTTVPNPQLKDPNNSAIYFPAYTLTDESAERQGGRRNGIKQLVDQPYQGEGLADGVTDMSNDSIHWEARYLPAGPPRLLGWNVPAEEIVHIPEHWLVYPEPNPSLHYLLALLYILFTFLALLGNGLVIWIFCAAKSLRTPSNMFVVNLAICDFFMMIKTPIFIYNSFNTGFALGHLGCQIFAVIGALSGIGASMTNAAIAYDRYSTIARPLDGKLSRGQVILFIVLIWTYTIPWALMPVMGVFGRFVPEGFLTSCSFDYLTDSNEIRIFVATIFTFSYCIPMLLIIYYYSQIVSHVVNHEKALREQAKKMNVDSLRSNANTSSQSAEIRIAKAAITICFLFVLSWTPYGVMAMIGAFGNKALLTPGVTMIPACACKGVACLDPYVYAISHPKYRLELQKRLPWLELQEKPISDSTSTTTETVNAPPASS